MREPRLWDYICKDCDSNSLYHGCTCLEDVFIGAHIFAQALQRVPAACDIHAQDVKCASCKLQPSPRVIIAEVHLKRWVSYNDSSARPPACRQSNAQWLQCSGGKSRRMWRGTHAHLSRYAKGFSIYRNANENWTAEDAAAVAHLANAAIPMPTSPTPWRRGS